MKKILVVFVEITEYNLARVQNVYEKMEGYEFSYVYCSKSVSGHETSRTLPNNATILQGSNKQKKRQLVKIAKEQKVDFVVINGYSDSVRLKLILYCRKHKIPYSIETDTPLNIPNSKLKRIAKRFLLEKIFSKNCYGFAGGTRQKELFSYYGMPSERIKVLPMTVDVDLFKSVYNSLSDKEDIKAKKGLENKKIVLYVGRFAPEKNLITLLNATKKVLQDFTDACVCLVGKGPQKEELLEYVKNNNIENNVFFFEYMPFEKLVEFYKMADVFVLPSTYEPWGLVVNESLACYLPVLASSKVGCVDDLIKENVNGDVFNCYDEENLAFLIQKWINKKTDKENFSIMNRWNHESYRKILYSCFAEVLGGDKNK